MEEDLDGVLGDADLNTFKKIGMISIYICRINITWLWCRITALESIETEDSEGVGGYKLRCIYNSYTLLGY